MSVSGSAVEIIFFESSNFYQADPAGALAGVAEALKTEGSQISNVYHAPQVEDSTKAYFIIQWKSSEHFKTTKGAELNNELLDAVGPSLSPGTEIESPTKIFQIKFDKDPSKALEAPVTEIAIATLNVPEKRDTLAGYVAKYDEYTAEGKVSSAWGQAFNNQNVFVLIVGWESVEAHRTARSNGTEELKAMSAELHKIASVKGPHARLIKCT